MSATQEIRIGGVWWTVRASTAQDGVYVFETEGAHVVFDATIEHDAAMFVVLRPLPPYEADYAALPKDTRDVLTGTASGIRFRGAS